MALCKQDDCLDDLHTRFKNKTKINHSVKIHFEGAHVYAEDPHR